MLDHFLKIAYRTDQENKAQLETHNLLKRLPLEDLHKLASGEMTKEAYLDSSCSKSAGEGSWITQFEGTPLFDQAVALEQEEIQLDMDQLQKSQADREERKARQAAQDNESIWDLKSQLRLKKRLLELQAAQVKVTGQAPPSAMPQEGAPISPEAPAQGAGAPGAEGSPAEKTVMAGIDSRAIGKSIGSAARLGTGIAVGSGLAYTGYRAAKKLIGPEKQEEAQKLKMAEDMGRALARNDFEKQAASQAFLASGDLAGRAMTGLLKEALDLKSLGGAAMKTFGNKGALIGAGLGGAAGLASGLQKDQNGQRHILSGLAQGAAGAAGGAAIGGVGQHAYQGISSRMGGGQGIGSAVKGYATDLKQKGQAAIGNAMKPSAGSVASAASGPSAQSAGLLEGKPAAPAANMRSASPKPLSPQTMAQGYNPKAPSAGALNAPGGALTPMPSPSAAPPMSAPATAAGGNASVPSAALPSAAPVSSGPVQVIPPQPGGSTDRMPGHKAMDIGHAATVASGGSPVAGNTPVADPLAPRALRRSNTGFSPEFLSAIPQHMRSGYLNGSATGMHG